MTISSTDGETSLELECQIIQIMYDLICAINGTVGIFAGDRRCGRPVDKIRNKKKNFFFLQLLVIQLRHMLTDLDMRLTKGIFNILPPMCSGGLRGEEGFVL